MKIICIGRNYADHATELGNSIPSEPLFFLKPDSAILAHRHPFYLPDWSQEIHYEVELLVRISKLGKSIAPEFAHRYYDAISLGIDFTARDIQAEVKAKGHPWEKAKAFDGSAVISREWLPLDSNQKGVLNKRFRLERNGEVVQQGQSKDMLFDIDQLIAYVSKFMTLKLGDVIFTGTPSGVGPVTPGDNLEGFLEDRSMFRVPIR
ncbi:MAG: fumarylacetoacetate hydrolase family protein [Flavobacteriales bacterium]|nr:fumarylacetoacetate hydrolase family protein [Flavobacteriales bacterium]